MTPKSETRHFKDLTAIRRPDGSILAFHARNLEVAQLSPEAWQALDSAQTQFETNGSLAFAARPSPLSGDILEALESLREWEASKSLTVKHERRETGVRALTVNVTQICNLHCKYCAAGGNGSYGDPIKRIVVAETVPALAAFIAKVPRGEDFRLTFLGGEPLLYPEGIQVLADEAQRLGEAHGVRVLFTLVTNGTLLTSGNVDLIKRFKMDVTVSIDGPAEVNDQRRPTKGGRGATALVEEGLARLLAMKSQFGKVMLSGVFGRGNMDLMRAFFYYRQFNVDWFDFTYDHNETSSEINDEFKLQIARVAEVAWQLDGEKGLRRIHMFDRLFNLLDSQQQIENYCGAGKSFLMMDARQNLYTCPWVVGEAKEIVGFGGTTWEDRLTSYQAPLIEKNGCGSCWARFLCGGGCMFIHRQATGDKHRVDKNFCERTQFLIETTLVYYEQTRR